MKRALCCGATLALLSPAPGLLADSPPTERIEASAPLVITGTRAPTDPTRADRKSVV